MSNSTVKIARGNDFTLRIAIQTPQVVNGETVFNDLDDAFFDMRA